MTDPFCGDGSGEAEWVGTAETGAEGGTEAAMEGDGDPLLVADPQAPETASKATMMITAGNTRSPGRVGDDDMTMSPIHCGGVRNPLG